MNLFPDSTTFIQIGVLSIKWYAILIMSGVILAGFLSWRDIKKCGYQFEVMEDLFMGCLLSGVVGARLWFCLYYDAGFYLTHPLEIVKVFNGGLAIHGGLLAGVTYGLYFCKKRQISFLRLADCVFPSILIAQAVGRWGNFINREAFGNVVQESYFQFLPAFIKEGMFIGGAYYEPTFLLESIASFIGFLLLWFAYRNTKSRRRGDLMYGYFLWYGMIRFFIEAHRTDSLMLGSLQIAQVISLLFMVVGVLGIFGCFQKWLGSKKKPIILFDLDGTLLDTEPAILESYRQLFEKYKPEVEFDRAKQVSVLGPSLETMFAVYFPEQKYETLLVEYRKVNYAIHEEYVKPMNNAHELLESLQQQGYRLGIVSTKLHDAVCFGLSLFDMEKYFEVIIGGNDVKHGKPAPDGILNACQKMNVGQDCVVFVGDSKMDIQAARAAGVFSIGYIFSEDRKQALVEEKPNRMIHDLIEIETILKEEHEWTSNMM